MKRWLPRVAGRADNNPRISAIEAPARKLCSAGLFLEDHFDSKLYLARRRGGSGELTRHSVRVSRTIKNVGIGGGRGRSKVDVIENVEDLRAELHVESL